MKKLLLTGASGFLGWNLCQSFQEEWEITGTIHTKDINTQRGRIVRADLTNNHVIDSLFSEIQPDGVMHTAAISIPGYCQENPEATYKINVTACETLAAKCAERNIPFVFTSTDLVFDGKKGNYHESDPVNPVNKYGEQKAIAEEKILQIYPQATICRMPLMLGESGQVAASYLQSFLENVRQGNEQKLFTDELRSVLGGQSAAAGLFLALNKLKGIYHLGGRENISRFDLGLMLVRIFDINGAKLTPTRLESLQISTPRSPDVTLDSSKAYNAGFEPLRLEEEIKRIKVRNE